MPRSSSDRGLGVTGKPGLFRASLGCSVSWADRAMIRSRAMCASRAGSSRGFFGVPVVGLEHEPVLVAGPAAGEGAGITGSALDGGRQGVAAGREAAEKGVAFPASEVHVAALGRIWAGRILRLRTRPPRFLHIIALRSTVSCRRRSTWLAARHRRARDVRWSPQSRPGPDPASLSVPASKACARPWSRSIATGP